jgi:hypothetical protein
MAPNIAKPSRKPTPEMRDEQRQRDRRDDREPDDLHRPPRVLAAAPRGDQHERGNRHGQQAGAEPVDAVFAASLGQVQGRDQHEQGDAAERQIHVERPPPAEVISDEAAGKRAGDHGQRHDSRHDALVPAAFPGRYQVADDRHHVDDEAAGAETLDRPEGDQLDHAVAGAAEQAGSGRAAERRADEEDDDRGQEDRLAAEQVAHLAPDRGGDGGAEHVRGDDPGQVGEAAEFADDAGHGRTDDEVVQHRQHHGQQQPRQDHQDLTLHARRPVTRHGSRGGLRHDFPFLL